MLVILPTLHARIQCDDVKSTHKLKSCCDTVPQYDHTTTYRTDYLFFSSNQGNWGDFDITTSGQSNCATLQTAHDTLGCCDNNEFSTYQGRSVLGDVTLLSNTQTQEFDHSDGKQYLVHFNALYSIWLVNFPAHLYEDAEGKKIMDIYAHWMGACGTTYITTPCAKLLNPEDKWHPSNVRNYDWTELLARARGIYNTNTEKYHISSESWNGAMLSSVGTSYDGNAIRIKADMTSSDDTWYVSSGLWHASHYPGNNFANQKKPKQDLFNPDGSFKPCQNMWSIGGWGDNYRLKVEINNGTNEMTYLSKYRAPTDPAGLVPYTYVPKVTYWDPEKKIYVYDRSIPPIVWDAENWGPQASVSMEIDVKGNATSYDETFFVNKMESIFPLTKVTAEKIDGGCAHPICLQYRLRVEFLFDNYKASTSQAVDFISSYKLEDLNGLLAADNIVIRRQAAPPTINKWCPYGFLYDRFYPSGIGVNVYCEGGGMATSMLWDFGCDD